MIWMALAVLCIVYGIIVRAVGSGTSFFLVWLGLGVICLLLAVAARLDVWSRIPSGIQKLFLGLIGVGLCLFVVIEGLVLSGFGKQGEKDLDYVIVLGAQVYESGPSRVLKYRLDEAIEYLEENKDTICIVSGGQGYNEPYAEAVVMARYLEGNGIEKDRILLEDKSKTTEQNIKYSKKLMEEGASVGIVTNNFHVFRALQIAKDQGLTDACGVAADTTFLYLPNNMVREFFGEIKYLLLKIS